MEGQNIIITFDSEKITKDETVSTAENCIERPGYKIEQFR
ncbi:hypothetical protein BMS3Bbin08_02594 [bacterium BMS3Bbin08]|nr:hypothetical protein BMS3Bbin08_02594 [bacterium BMS3Bbin08]